MIVSNAFAKHYFPNEDAVGKRLVMDGPDKTPREIIGVVGDVRRKGLDVGTQSLRSGLSKYTDKRGYNPDFDPSNPRPRWRRGRRPRDVY